MVRTVSNVVTANESVSAQTISDGAVTDGQRRWSAPKRFGFCFVCVFLLLAFADTYEPWGVIPFVGSFLSSCVDAPLLRGAEWMAVHVFNITGVVATPHATDSRDTALSWITILLIASIAFVAALVWSALARRRQNLETTAVWMRYVVRIALVFVMLRYAIFKIFPLQMSHPSLGVLNEPVGNSSPMTLLWTLIGLNPVYQSISGVLEALSAFLLLFRRTALLGALVGFVVMANVVLLNFCFDVPVKLGAMLILFAFIVLLWPDLPPLFALFWKHRSAKLESRWVPNFKTLAGQRIATGLVLLYVLCALYNLVPFSYHSYIRETENRRAPSPLSGEWRVDSAQMISNGRTVDAPVLTAEGLPMTAIYLEPDGRVMVRSSDGRLWRASAAINGGRHTFSLYSNYFEGTRFEATYSYTQPDENHLRLEPVGNGKASDSTLLLTRIPLPATYPLLQAHFHWVEEWALER